MAKAVGADPTGLRDTAMTAPAPAPMPVDSAVDTTRQHSSVNATIPAPERNPMRSPADVEADRRATDSLNRAALERINGRDDTMPQPLPLDTASRRVRDSTLPDSTQPR